MEKSKKRHEDVSTAQNFVWPGQMAMLVPALINMDTNQAAIG